MQRIAGEKRLFSTYYLMTVLLLIACSQSIHAQIEIKGIECVTSGADYEYRFNAGWDSTANIKICVVGGIIADTKSNCISGAGISVIKIRWDETSKNGSITIDYPKGHMKKNVNITPLLQGGLVDSTKKLQSIAFKKLPSDIECTPAIGGGCNPVYNYQWQQSNNFFKWQDVPGAQGKKLKYSSPLTETTYFRRKVTEYNSGNIAYSDEVTVLVDIDYTGHK